MQPSILSQKAAARARIVATAGELTPPVASGSTSNAVRVAAADAVDRHLCDHYTRRPGIAPLCQAVAAYLTTLRVPTNENDVVISGSIQEARYVALRSLAVGKTVYVQAPTEAPYATASQFAGASVVLLRDGEELPEGASGLLLVTREHGHGTQHAAPGAPAKPARSVAGGPQESMRAAREGGGEGERLQRLAQWAAANNLTVVADETAAPLGGYAPFASLVEMAQRTLTLGSFVGVAGLGAWQVSWFAGPKGLLAPVRDLKQSITICTSAPSQYAALAALQEQAAASTPKSAVSSAAKEQA